MLLSQFNMHYECGWVSGDEEKLISNYELCKNLLCAPLNTNVNHLLHCLKVIKFSDITYYNVLSIYCICTLKITAIVINKTFPSINDSK